MYVLNLQDKADRRRERIKKILPTQQSEGKNIEEISKELENEYSVGTIRIDLLMLTAAREIQSDDKRRPAIYWRGRQK